MPLRVHKTSIPEVLLFEPDVFKDQRGFFLETYHRRKYEEHGLSAAFVQDNFSHSTKNTLRGLHYQLHHPQGKLVFVTKGAVFDVAVDIRRGSPTFGHWISEVLSDDNNRQMFIPEGFAHGFCVLSDTADFIYKCTNAYHSEDDRGINWQDNTLSISWPVAEPLLSNKDSILPMLHELPEELLPVYRGQEPPAGI